MKRDKRRYEIIYSNYGDFEKTPDFYCLPKLLLYKGRKAVLSAGTSDHITVLRQEKNFAILSTNQLLGYAGLQVINSDLMTEKLTENSSEATISEVFIDNLEQINSDLSKDFFDYTENVQADILLNYLKY
jgi:hypothetical protein